MPVPDRPSAAPLTPRLAALLPALALALSPLVVPHALVLALLWLAQPAYAAGIAHLRQRLDPAMPGGDAARRLWPWTVQFTSVSLVLAALVVAPLEWLLRGGGLAAVLVLSAGSVFALLALAHLWRPLGLLWVWSEARPLRSSAGTALQRCQRFAARRLRPGSILDLLAVLGLLALLAAQAGIALGVDRLADLPRIALVVLNAALLTPLLHGLQHALAERIALTPLRADPVPAPAAASDAQTAVTASPAPAADATPPDDSAALYAAARAGQVDSALQRIGLGADPHAPPPADDRDQRSLATLAALLPDLRLLRALIAARVDLNHASAGITPLLAATRDSWAGRHDAVMTLLANGADPRIADAQGRTALHGAALSTDPDIAALLLDAGALIDALDRDGQSPLALACGAGNWRLARFLLERGARAEPERGQPALIAAAGGEDDPAGVQLLLKHRARVDARGTLGRTALMAAALSGNAEVAKALIAAGAAIDARDEHGVTALMEAARSGADAVIDVLAARSPDANARDASGRSVLTIACRSRRADVGTLRRLLALGADPLATDPQGRRALDDALQTGRWRLVALLDPAYPIPASIAEALAQDAPAADAGATDAASAPDATADAPDADDIARRLALGDRIAPDALFAHALDAAQRGELDRLQAVALHAAPQELRDAAGRPLLDHLLAQGPAHAAAVRRLLDLGAPCGGMRLARHLQACLDARAAAPAHERLALDLLERGADPFAPATGRETALHLALRLDWLALAEALLARGCNPEARDPRGWTPLYLACTLGFEPGVRLLVRAGADPEARAADGQTPLGLALSVGRKDLAHWLRWTRWTPPHRALRDTDLIAAAALGDTGAVDRLVGLGLSREAVDAQGCTALLRAAGAGHADTVRRLLQLGLDPGRAAHSGATALSAAVSMRRLEVIDALLDGGAVVDQRLPNGVTALMVAAALGLPDAATRLLRAGAAVDARDARDGTALHAAAQFVARSAAHAEAGAILRTLLDAGAPAAAVDHDGLDPLCLLLGAQLDAGVTLDDAALSQHVRTLLAHGAGFEARDPRGFGALHLAALHGLGRCIHVLMAAGADPQRQDSIGRRPADIALMRGFVDLATQLRPGAGGDAPSIARFLSQPPR